MEAARALGQLTEESAQIEAACVFDSSGNELASTLRDETAARSLLAAARALLAGVSSLPRESGAAQLAQLEAAMLEGSVFVVVDGDLAVCAVTRPEPTVGLVFYDLKSCLRAAGTPGDGDGRPKPADRKPAAVEEV